ncbi:hypothetical protein BJX63DRAFT_181853 [Aspergillus granulosus]|uniref:Uncharacterized protein n=1 Tax=Aspergillus granulosus TaxID=176169 RepID=A0ABR4I2S9_9EURO
MIPFAPFGVCTGRKYCIQAAASSLPQQINKHIQGWRTGTQGRKPCEAGNSAGIGHDPLMVATKWDSQTNTPSVGSNDRIVCVLNAAGRDHGGWSAINIVQSATSPMRRWRSGCRTREGSLKCLISQIIPKSFLLISFATGRCLLARLTGTRVGEAKLLLHRHSGQFRMVRLILSGSGIERDAQKSALSGRYPSKLINPQTVPRERDWARAIFVEEGREGAVPSVSLKLVATEPLNHCSQHFWKIHK